MVVVGGRDSSNTIQLVRVCQPHCPTYHVELAAELRASDFAGLEVVGVVAGASTRESDIREVIDFLAQVGAGASDSVSSRVSDPA
jgi:4-hydroxy-3-methylbut-2-enyl diphosphate reductase